MENSIDGYISDLSPVKLANNQKTRYFTAQIQTDKQEKRRIVCFTPGKHSMFKVASESKDVFRLNNAKITPSKDGQLEIKVFNETELIKSAKKLAFTKAYGTVFNIEEDIQEATNLVDIKSDFQMATVHVKFLGFTDSDRKVNTRYGPKSIAIGRIADKTASTQIVVWNQELKQKLAAGDFFKITQLKNKIFDERPQMNRTSSTSITSITPFEGVKEEDEIKEKEQLIPNTSFSTIQVSNQLLCKVCFKQLELPSAPVVRCGNCKYKHLVKDIAPNLSINGHINMGNETKKVRVPQEVITVFLHDQNKSSLLSDSDALEDFLMLNTFILTVKNSEISKIEIITY